jgi:phosphoribosylformimino-5-aminoimidazole carboxamide ribotide isomerase
MIAFAAIDLREGACVQLVGGSYDNEAIRISDPVEHARAFLDQGVADIHVVDLDAATERGDNLKIIERIAMLSFRSIHVGGGIRSMERARSVHAAGATKLVTGTRAIAESDFLETLSTEFPFQVIVALDVQGREVLTRGWKVNTGKDIEATLLDVDRDTLHGFLITAVHLEGKLSGIDEDLYRDVVPLTQRHIYASGGIASRDDLARLSKAGCQGAVIGMALYTGAISIQTLIEESR